MQGVVAAVEAGEGEARISAQPVVVSFEAFRVQVEFIKVADKINSRQAERIIAIATEVAAVEVADIEGV